MRQRVPGRLLLGSVIVLSVLAPAEPAAAADFTVGGEQTVVGKVQRRSAGLHAWPDGTFGVEKTGSNHTFYAADGSSGVARTVGSLNSPIAASVTEFAITGKPADIQYAGGGPVFDAGTMKLMFLHLERWYAPASGLPFQSYVGLAKSTDGGLTWTFLGTIMAPTMPFRACPRGTDVGGAPYIIRTVDGQDYFYTYVKDQPNCANEWLQTVIRAPVSEVVAAAGQGTVSEWSKYYNGSFSQPAVESDGTGGLSSDIWPVASRGYALRWMDVKWNTYHNRFVMVHSSFSRNWLGFEVYTFYLTESADGVSWSTPQVLFAITSLLGPMNEANYPTLIGLDEDPNVLGKSFWVYYVQDKRWDCTKLVRRHVVLT